MKLLSLLPLLLCLSAANLCAQRAVLKNPTNGALVEGFATGANTITLSATGTLHWTSGATLGGSTSAFRTAAGLAIGSDVQAYSANLTTYAGITPSANVQSLLAAADYSAMRTLLGLVIGTNVQAYDAELSAFASLANAAGLLTNNGGGTLSYTGASTGGNAAADSGKLATYLADGTLTGTGLRSYASDSAARYATLLSRSVAFTNVGGTGFYVELYADDPTASTLFALPAVTGGSATLISTGNLSAITALGTITSGTWNGSDIALAYIAQGGATDGQTLVWDNTAGTWEPGTISSGLTIGTTTTSGASAGDILTSDGTLLQKITPGTGIATWLATPSKANLNTAVSDDDPAYVGTANTFSAAQIVSMGAGDPFKVQYSGSDRFKVTTTATAGNIWFGDAAYFAHETSNGSWIMKYAGSERARIIFAENAYNIELKTGTTGDYGVLVANNSYNGAYLASDLRLNTTVGVFKIEANPRQAFGAYVGPGHTLALIGGQAQTTSTGGAGGLVSITGGAAGGTGDNNGGNVTIAGGAPTGSGNKGTVTIGSRGSGITDIATVVKASHDCASIAAGATETTTATITGAAAGSTFIPSPIVHEGLVISAARTGTDTVTITFYNPTAGAIDASAVDVRVTEIAF